MITSCFGIAVNVLKQNRPLSSSYKWLWYPVFQHDAAKWAISGLLFPRCHNPQYSYDFIKSLLFFSVFYQSSFRTLQITWCSSKQSFASYVYPILKQWSSWFIATYLIVRQCFLKSMTVKSVEQLVNVFDLYLKIHQCDSLIQQPVAISSVQHITCASQILRRQFCYIFLILQNEWSHYFLRLYRCTLCLQNTSKMKKGSVYLPITSLVFHPWAS